MQLSTRLFSLLTGLLIVLAIGATARVSLGDEAPGAAPAVTGLESTIFDLGLVDADLAPADECVAPAEPQAAPDKGTSYECPKGVPYCQRDSQCESFCGGGFEVCFQGCCTCAG